MDEILNIYRKYNRPAAQNYYSLQGLREYKQHQNK